MDDPTKPNSNDLPSPDWHADILADRKKRAERGEVEFLTIEKLKARLGIKTSGNHY